MSRVSILIGSPGLAKNHTTDVKAKALKDDSTPLEVAEASAQFFAVYVASKILGQETNILKELQDILVKVINESWDKLDANSQKNLEKLRDCVCPSSLKIIIIVIVVVVIIAIVGAFMFLRMRNNN